MCVCVCASMRFLHIPGSCAQTTSALSYQHDQPKTCNIESVQGAHDETTSYTCGRHKSARGRTEVCIHMYIDEQVHAHMKHYQMRLCETSKNACAYLHTALLVHYPYTWTWCVLFLTLFWRCQFEMVKVPVCMVVVYVCMYTFCVLHACMYVWMYVHTYIRTHVCAYAYICASV